MIKTYKKPLEKMIRKGTAIFVCAAFLATSVYLPRARAEISPALMTGYRSLADDLTGSIDLPKKMGKIEEIYRGTGDKIVVLIQDAHSIPDAQRSIQSAIDYFQTQYGISLVGLEGASEKLDPQIFRSFPDKELLRKTFDAYSQRGELTGGTAAALFNTSASAYYGIEDWSLYEAGVSYFLEATAMEGEIEKFLEPMEAALTREKEAVYSSALLEIDRSLADFDRNQIDLAQVLGKLAEYQPPPQGSELAILLEEIRQSQMTDTPVEIEIKKIAGQIFSALKNQPLNPEARRELQEFNGNFQEFRTGRTTPQAFAFYLRGLAKKHGVRVKVSRGLAYLTGHQKRLKDIEGTRLFGEFRRYANSVKESLFHNDRQKALDIKTCGLDLMKRLARLELSFEDWEKVQKLTLRPDQWTATQDPVVSHEEISILLNKMEPHLAFYHVAEKRDKALLENIRSMMTKAKQESSLVVAGGFHTEGLTRELKKKGISYVLVMPRIGSIPEEPLYREHMRGQVSWSDYFEVKDGKVNLYDAFVRATRDKLLGDKNALATGGKEWRDQIIRDLASEGRITEAGDYTRFIDERTGTPNLELQALREQWLANIDRFGEGLRKLHAEGNLSESSIMQLIKTITIPEVSLANQLAPGVRAEVRLLPLIQDSESRPSIARRERPETRRSEPKIDIEDRLVAEVRAVFQEQAGEYAASLPTMNFDDAFKYFKRNDVPYDTEARLSEPLSVEMLKQIAQESTVEIGIMRLRDAAQTWIFSKGDEKSCKISPRCGNHLIDVSIHNHPNDGHPVPSSGDVFNQFSNVGVSTWVLGTEGLVFCDADRFHDPNNLSEEDNLDLHYLQLEEAIPGGWERDPRTGRYSESAKEAIRKFWDSRNVKISDLRSWDDFTLSEITESLRDFTQVLLRGGDKERHQALHLFLTAMPPAKAAPFVGLFNDMPYHRTQSLASEWLSQHFDTRIPGMVSSLESFTGSKFSDIQERAFEILISNSVISDSASARFRELATTEGLWELLSRYDNINPAFRAYILREFGDEVRSSMADAGLESMKSSPSAIAIAVEGGYQKEAFSLLDKLLGNPDKFANGLAVLAMAKDGQDLLSAYLAQRDNSIDPVAKILAAAKIGGANRSIARFLIASIPFEYFHQIFQVSDVAPGRLSSGVYTEFFDDEFIARIRAVNPYDADRASIMREAYEKRYEIGLSPYRVRAWYLSRVEKLQEVTAFVADAPKQVPSARPEIQEPSAQETRSEIPQDQVTPETSTGQPATAKPNTIAEALNAPDFEPKKLIEALKKVLSLGPLYSMSVGVWEGYTLEEHTLLAMSQFEKYFSATQLPGKGDKQIFRILLALHDIGKPQAVAYGRKEEQHARTLEIINEIKEELPLSPEQLNVVMSLVDGDPIGLFIRGRADLESTVEEIRIKAEKAGLTAAEFFDLLTIYYQMDASSYTADSGGKASLEFLFVKDQERNRFAFDPVKKRLKFSPKVQALFNALEVAVRAEYLDRLIKSSNMLSSFKKYSTVAELKEALPGRFMTIQDFVKTKARWVRGGYSLGLSKGYHLYFGWSRLCGLIDWMTAYALELIGFVEPGHTDAFLSQITRDNKLIVFFVPDGMWDSGVTRDEMNWIAEKLQSKPDAFNILFVFGAYDTYFSPADLQVYTQKGKEAFDDLMATRVREDLGSGMSDEEREKLEEDINSNIKEYEERRKKAYKMRELENELRNLPWSVVLRDATSRLRDAVFKSKKPKAGKAGEPSADSRPEASDSRSELSQASPGTVENLASMLRPGRKADLSRSEVRAIYEVTLRGDQDALVETLKRIAEKQIAEASMSAGTARVTREMAVATINMIIEALKAAGVKGNLTMIFDVSPDKNFMEALQAVKDEIGTAVFTKGAVRNLDRKALEGVTIQTVGSLKSYKPLAAENAEAVPVLSQNLGSDYFANEVLFGVGLDAGDVQGEPFLEVTENVLRMAVGLLKADLMTRGMEPEEINAKLMEILFKLDTDSGRGVLSVNGRHLVVHREALQQMMVEYQATAEIQRAA